MNLFFSYGHDDNESLVFDLADDVQHDGHQVWIDKNDLRSSDNWRDKITEGILQSESVLSFLSEHSMRDHGVCRDELMIAVGIRGSMIQGLLLDKKVTVPRSVSYHQFIDLSEWREKKNEGEEQYKSWYAGKLNEIRSFINDEKTQQYAREIEEIRKVLSPDLTSLKQARLQGRRYCNRNGLIEAIRPVLSGSARHIAIIGGPGCGKSMFIAHQSLFFDLFKTDFDKDDLPAVRAVLFCDYKNRSANNVKAITMNLAYQLAAKDSDYRHALKRIMDRLQKQFGEDFFLDATDVELFNDLIVLPLNSLIDGSRQDIYILIDGIDELHTESGQAKAINPMIEVLFEHLEDMPEWVHFILTARPDTSLIHHLQNKFAFILIEDLKDANIREVQEYLENRFKESSHYGKIQARTIAEKSEGNFLYADLVGSALLDGSLSMDEIETIPGKLSDVYLKIFEKQFPDPDIYYEIYFEVFAALAVSPAPVPDSTFNRLTKWKSGPKTRRIQKLSIFLRNKEAGKSFSSYAFFHKSLQDWLLSDNSYMFQIDPEDGFKALARACLSSYQESVEDMNDFELQHLILLLEKTNNRALSQVLMDEELAWRLTERAQQHFESRNYDTALELWILAVRIYTGLFDQQDDKSRLLENTVPLLEKVVNLSHRQAWPDLTRKWAEKAIELLNSESGQKYSRRIHFLAGFYFRNGYALFRQGQYQEAEEAYKRSIEHYYLAGDTVHVYEAARILLEKKRLNSELKEALSTINAIESRFPLEELKQSSPAGYCAWIRTASWILFDSSKKVEAMRQMDECELFMQTCSDSLSSNDKGKHYYIRSVMAYGKQDYEGCSRFCEKSLKELREEYGNNAVELCDTLNEMGAAQRKLGNLAQACDLFYESYLIRRNHYTDMNMLTSISLGNYADTLTEIGTPEALEEAGPMLQVVCEIRQKICTPNNLFRLGCALKQRGSWLLKTSQPEQAAEIYQQAETLFKNVYETKQSSVFLGEAGVCLKEQAKAALQMDDPKKAVLLLQNALTCLAQAFKPEHGAYREAKKLLEHAENLLENSADGQEG